MIDIVAPRAGAKKSAPKFRKRSEVEIPSGAKVGEYTPISRYGVTCWENARNKFFVMRISHLAHPEKRHPLWIEHERGLNPALFDREEAVDFSSRKGLRVFQDFSFELTECDLTGHYSSESLVIRPFKIPDWWHVFTVTDPGKVAEWATLVVAIDENGIWFVIGELVRAGMDYPEAKRLIHRDLLRGRRPIENIIDTDATKRRIESLHTLIELLAKKPHALDCVTATKKASDFAMIQLYRDRLARRPIASGATPFGVYFFATCHETINQHRTAVYTDGDTLLNKGIGSVDAMKYGATHWFDKPIRPRKPEHLLTEGERMGKMFAKDRLRSVKAARLAQRKRDEGVASEAYEGW